MGIAGEPPAGIGLESGKANEGPVCGRYPPVRRPHQMVRARRTNRRLATVVTARRVGKRRAGGRLGMRLFAAALAFAPAAGTTRSTSGAEGKRRKGGDGKKESHVHSYGAARDSKALRAPQHTRGVTIPRASSNGDLEARQTWGLCGGPEGTRRECHMALRATERNENNLDRSFQSPLGALRASSQHRAVTGGSGLIQLSGSRRQLSPEVAHTGSR